MKQTKQQRYRQRLKDAGFVPLSGHIPEHAHADMLYMINWICDEYKKGNEYIPFMARNLKTGVMKKAVQKPKP